MSEVQTGIAKTELPARLDRLPWSRWHWMIILGLGTGLGAAMGLEEIASPITAEDASAPAR